ncbi:SpvB/TcaC N-terminal domain-containing protein [Candidatus Omnitrophota bacterium]
MKRKIFLIAFSFMFLAAYSLFAEEIAVEEPSQEIQDAKEGDGQPSRSQESVESEGAAMMMSTIEGEQPYVSTEKFQVEPSTGSATLSLPIQAIQGRKGIQPTLALTYSSSSPNGIAGVGWSLELGSIQRSTKRGLPFYDDAQDTFVLTQQGSTQELVYDSSAGFYRAKIEGAFMRIEFINNTYWLVTDKEGIKYYFGQTAASQQEDTGKIFKWCLDRVEDLHNNYMKIIYLKDQGQIYPEYIHYTGDSTVGDTSFFAFVQFMYETRTDISLSFRTGFAVTTQQRLREIVAKKTPDQLIRGYALTYSDPSASTQRSLLRAVTQYGDGSDASSIPPTEFFYNEGVTGWTLDPSYTMPLETRFSSHNGIKYMNFHTRIADITNDGFADVLSYHYDYPPTTRKTFLSNQDGTWSETANWQLANEVNEFVRNCEEIDREFGVRIVDVNGDGWQDIVKRYRECSGTLHNVTYLNNKVNGWNYSAEWLMPDGTTIVSQQNCPEYDYMVFNGVVFSDINADGYFDIVKAKGSTRKVYINQASSGDTGWVEAPEWVIPSDVSFTEGATLVDLNADGLPDIPISRGTSTYKAYIHNGYGWQEHLNFSPPEGNIKEGDTQFADVNADGLPDLLYNRGDNKRHTYLNTGDGWQRAIEWDMPEGNFRDYYVQLFDIDADGMMDVAANYGNDGLKAYINNSESSDTLRQVSNNIGASTVISYVSSTVYDNTGDDSISDLPFQVQTVSSVTSSEEYTGQSYTTDYTYKNGMFDFPSREFRGFGYIKITDADNNYTETEFLQGEHTKGRIKEQRTYDAAGNLYARVVNNWLEQEVCPGSQFVKLGQADNYSCDGDLTCKQTTVIYQEYDEYGNVEEIHELGDVSQTGDERYAHTEYVYNTTDWLLRLPVTTYMLDHTGSTVKQSWFYYDEQDYGIAPAIGNLSKQEAWFKTPTNLSPAPGSAENPTTEFEYDAYANVVKTIDANNHHSTVTYDGAYHMFPVVIANHLGHFSTNIHYGVTDGGAIDPYPGEGSGLWGQLKATVDINEDASLVIYDSFGRVSKKVSSQDSVDLPTAHYDYHFKDWPPADPSSNTRVVSHQREISGQAGTLDSASFYDGLGRLIQAKSESETPGTFVISGQTEFNSRGLPEKKYLPFFDNTYSFSDVVPLFQNPYLPTTIAYDPVGRITQTANPDGTSSEIQYDDWVATAINENGHMQKSYVDAYGRLIKKEEYIGADGRDPINYPVTPYALYATTLYAYDCLGNLTSTTDSLGNLTTINYDTLGRKTSMDDSDMGTWSYEYDAAGNLIGQTDAKNQTIDFDYDVLNRLINKTDMAGEDVHYTYDDPAMPYPKGRLTQASYALFDDTKFHYDALGREIKSEKKIEGINYEVQRTYDAVNRLETVEYPDSEIATYSYNSAGQVERIEGISDADTDTKLLLHADGYDGSTVFLDSSLSNHLVSANGDAQLDTAEHKFGGSSGLFDGSGDYLSISDSEDWNFDGGDFTIDVWVKFSSLDNTTMLLSQHEDDNNYFNVFMYGTNNSNKLAIICVVEGTTVVHTETVAQAFVADAWYHIAFVRSVDQAYIFVNGAAQPFSWGGTFTGSMGDMANDLWIGAASSAFPHYYYGWMDEIRISKDIARWTSNFIPPVEPYFSSTQSYVTNVDYNAAGQIIKIEYGNGTVTDYAFDPLTLRLTQLVTTDSALQSIQDLSYQYDSAGNILSITNNLNSVYSQNFTYDELNRLMTANGVYGSKAYAYDEIGNMILKDGVTYSYGEGDVGPHAITSGSDGSVFEYDDNGNMISWQTSNGRVYTYDFDAENRLKEVRLNNVTRATFEYDGDGGRTKKTKYTYQGGGRGCFLARTPIAMADGSTKPIEEIKVGDEVVSYDEKTKELVTDTVKETFVHEAGNYLIINDYLRVTPNHPVYSNGRWVEIGALALGDTLQDNQGKGVEIVSIQKRAENARVYNFEVNPYHTYFAGGILAHNKEYYQQEEQQHYGRRFFNNQPLRYVFEFLSSLLDPPIVEAATVIETPTIYVGSLYEKTNNTPTKHIFLGSQRITSITNGNLCYFHTNHQGSTDVITDDIGEEAVHYEYAPYGEIVVKEGSDITKYKFTGKPLDDETGLYYYGARYYNPLIGRFLTPDTIVQEPRNPQTLNRYSYCGNNPVNNVDPTGHSWFKKFFGQLFGAILGAVSNIFLPGSGVFVYSIISSGFTAGMNGGNVGRAIGIGIGASLVGFGVGGFAGNQVGELLKSGFWGEMSGLFMGGAAGGAFGTGIGEGDIGMAALAGGVGAAFGMAGPIGNIVGGGVSSEIAGGDFEEGAMGGAMYAAGNGLGNLVPDNGKYAPDTSNLQEGEVIIGSRPVNNPIAWLFGARHKFVIGPDGRWEMGSNPNSIPKGLISTVKGSAGGTYRHTKKYLTKYSRQVRWTRSKVNAQTFKQMKTNYANDHFDVRYNPLRQNSNYAINTVVYGSGGEITGYLGFAPAFE